MDVSTVVSTLLFFPLKRLKYLNLNDNEIYAIPRLRLLGTNLLHEPWPSQQLSTEELHPAKGFSTKSPLSKELTRDPQPLNTSSREHCSPNRADMKPHPLKEGEHSSSGQQFMKGAPDQVLQVDKEDPENLKPRNENDLVGIQGQSPVLQPVDDMDENINTHLLAPFPELRTLSLANNLVG